MVLFNHTYKDANWNIYKSNEITVIWIIQNDKQWTTINVEQGWPYTGNYQRQAISTCYLIILLFWLSSFKKIKCIYFMCMSVLLTHCLCTVYVLTAVEVRRGRWIPWTWRLWVTIWVLGIELRPLKEPQVLLIVELSLFFLLSYVFAMFSVFLRIEGAMQKCPKTCCAPFSCTYLEADLHLNFYSHIPNGLGLLQDKKAANTISIFSVGNLANSHMKKEGSTIHSVLFHISFSLKVCFKDTRASHRDLKELIIP